MKKTVMRFTMSFTSTFILVIFSTQNKTIKICINKLDDIIENGKFKATHDLEIKLDKNILKVYSTKGFIILQTGKNEFHYISLATGVLFETKILEDVIVK